MNAYPDLSQGLDSQQTILSGMQIDRATNGSVHGRMLYPDQKNTFQVVHPMITKVQKNDWIEFYRVNRAFPFTFTWKNDDVTYTCMFTEDPVVIKPAGPKDMWRIQLTLVQQ